MAWAVGGRAESRGKEVRRGGGSGGVGEGREVRQGGEMGRRREKGERSAGE